METKNCTKEKKRKESSSKKKNGRQYSDKKGNEKCDETKTDSDIKRWLTQHCI